MLKCSFRVKTVDFWCQNAIVLSKSRSNDGQRTARKMVDNTFVGASASELSLVDESRDVSAQLLSFLTREAVLGVAVDVVDDAGKRQLHGVGPTAPLVGLRFESIAESLDGIAVDAEMAVVALDVVLLFGGEVASARRVVVGIAAEAVAAVVDLIDSLGVELLVVNVSRQDDRTLSTSEYSTIKVDENEEMVVTTKRTGRCSLKERSQRPEGTVAEA